MTDEEKMLLDSCKTIINLSMTAEEAFGILATKAIADALEYLEHANVAKAQDQLKDIQVACAASCVEFGGMKDEATAAMQLLLDHIADNTEKTVH